MCSGNYLYLGMTFSLCSAFYVIRGESTIYNIDPEARFHQVEKWKEKEEWFNEIINSRSGSDDLILVQPRWIEKDRKNEMNLF